MRHFDLSPLYRNTVGFDRLFSTLDQLSGVEAGAQGYPPYNIERTDENAYRITVAVAGFTEDDLAAARAVREVVDDDFKLLKAQPLLPEGVERLFDPSGYVRVPEAARDQPSRAFLRWHRENCYKG